MKKILSGLGVFLLLSACTMIPRYPESTDSLSKNSIPQVTTTTIAIQDASTDEEISSDLSSDTAFTPSSTTTSTTTTTVTAAIFHLEKAAAKTYRPQDLRGVYWCARDLESSPVGNHHFVTIVFENTTDTASFAQKFPAFAVRSELNEKGRRIYYTCFGVSTDSNNRIVIKNNTASDIQAMKEIINPGKYTFWYKPDFDLEGHRIPESYPDYRDFAEKVIQLAINFNRSESSDYSLLSNNCATWVNTLLKVAGVPSGVRKSLGDFYGVDVAENKLLDESLFMAR
jgi:hypothetical protein